MPDGEGRATDALLRSEYKPPRSQRASPNGAGMGGSLEDAMRDGCLPIMAVPAVALLVAVKAIR